MGCQEASDKNVPTLLCFFETGNEEQKSYCLHLKDSFKPEKNTRFEIKSTPQVPFGVKFKINGKVYDIQTVYDNNPETREKTLEATLQKIYDLTK